MFDGSVPVQLERLKEIYRAVDHLHTLIAMLIVDAHKAGAPAEIQTRIEALENEIDVINALFEGVLTNDEQEELMR